MEHILEWALSFRELMSHHALFSVGLLLILGFFLGKLSELIKLPEITGYILAGLLLGDSLGGVIHHEMGESLKIVTDVALGLIAITIGGEFYRSKLKHMGKEVVIMTITQILLTFALVTAGLYIFKMPLPFALIMGAIATATAPAATVAIVQKLRAHGKFIDRLYGLVALDDAGCVVVFGIVFAVVSGIIAPGAEHLEPIVLVWHAFREIILSLLLGGVFGFFIHMLNKRTNHQAEIMILTLGFIFLETAMAVSFHLSPLLSNMAAGAVLINMSPKNHRVFRVIEPLTPPIYALFFAIAGTELNPSILFKRNILILGVVFVIARAIGKYFGVVSGAVIAKSKPNIRKYLGICMLPQAGVAIGLILMIQASPIMGPLAPEMQQIISLMVNIILMGVFINELIGPPLSKYAIVNALKTEEV